MRLTNVSVLAVIVLSVVAAPAAQKTPAPARSRHPLVKSAADGAACLRCHKKIASSPIVHAPVAGEHCASCHTVTTKGAVSTIGLAKGATRSNTTALCVSCHHDIAAKLKSPHAHEPAASGGCTSCHDPHRSAVPFLLAAGQRDLCTTCHDDVGGALRLPVVHAPAGTSCAICHDPHAAPLPKQLRVGVNLLCRSCHAGPRARPGVAEASTSLGRTLADNETRLLNAAPPILLDAAGTSGHPLDGHPVTGRADASAGSLDLNCVSCHSPHGARAAHLLPRGLTDPTELCVGCHK